MTTQLKYALLLWLAPEVGPATFNAIISQYPKLETVFDSPERVARTLALKPETLSYLHSPNWDQVEAHLAWQQAKPNRHIIAYFDPRYPSRLKDINDPPPILLVEGDVHLLNDPQLAMVGSRRMSPYGKENAYSFAKDLASAGLVITSGLALGIDAASHQGALASGGKTIAVLGSGIDTIYPQEHRALASKIAELGALVSEFPLGTGPSKYNFPRRNRIITGMSLGVLVVEAAMASGSLISARLAMEQNREVFAIPGSIHSPMSKGCHSLIRAGAKLIDASEDILLELKPWLEQALAPVTQLHESKEHANDAELDPEYRALLKWIGYETTAVDTLVEHAKLRPQEVSSMLLMLELQGYIAGVPGGYVKLREPT